MAHGGKIKIGVGAIGAAICLWLFLYISTIFPYLGSTSQARAQGVGVSLNAGSSDIGIKKMLLFEGQTAFFEYDVQSTADSTVYFDVKPITTFGFSDDVRKVKGNESGRVEFTITKTGLYTFDHTFGLNGNGTTARYQASWGAV